MRLNKIACLSFIVSSENGILLGEKKTISAGNINHQASSFYSRQTFCNAVEV